MFTWKHYVPILKWKRAEQGALKLMSAAQKKHITPLIQLVMPKYGPQDQLEDVIEKFEKKLAEIPEQLRDAWGMTPLFIDVSLLFTNPLRAKTLNKILTEGQRLGARFIPVIHLASDAIVKEAVYSSAKTNGTGLCLRVICPDLDNVKAMNEAIKNVIIASELKESEIDLLVDIKELDENGDKYSKYMTLSQGIVNLKKWRTFTFTSGAFPENLTNCIFAEENLIPRVGWQNWKQYTVNGKLERKPSFSDYTIQYPIYKDITQFFHPTTSIKYTLDDEWLIMKGKKQKFELYLASAALLVEDARYYGERYSAGDEYIAEKARHYEPYIKAKKQGKNIKGTGSTETWLRAGINHHLVLTSNQVANLS